LQYSISLQQRLDFRPRMHVYRQTEPADPVLQKVGSLWMATTSTLGIQGFIDPQSRNAEAQRLETVLFLREISSA